MRTRAFLLVVVVGVALVAAACGRAGPDEINQALSITPTATASAEQIAAATSAAATRSAEAAAAAVPGASPGAAVAAVGDVRRGSSQFRQVCSGCHRPGGPGGDILAPGGPGANVTADGLLVLIREGTDHPPGPYATTRVSDAAVNDLLAFILSEAGAPE